MIEIEFDYSDLDKIIDKLDRIPIRKFLKDLMMGAKQIVQQAYESQAFAENTNYVATVRTTAKNTATLTVRGEDVGFLEFGAGLTVMPDDFESQVPYTVAPGSYSIWHGDKMGQFAKTGMNFWFYHRVKYTAVEPTQGMQQALDFLRSVIADYMTQKIEAWLFRYGDI